MGYRPDRCLRNISNRAPGRAHGRPAVAWGDWISDGAGNLPSGFPSPPASLVFLLNWWDSLVLDEFGATTLAVAGWVSDRIYGAGRRPSSSPCDRIKCILDGDSPLGCAVILSPIGEGWAVGYFPGHFLRRSELIKRSLWLNDEPTWWCIEQLQYLVEKPRIPAVATPVPGCRFLDRWLVHGSRRRGSPRRSVVDYRAATTMALPPGHPKSDANCETREDSWRIKRTREGKPLTGQAPSETMGVGTEGTRDVDGCDDGGKCREGSQGKSLSLEMRLLLSIPPKEPG